MVQSRSASAAAAARVQEARGTGTTSASATLASTTNGNLLVAVLQFNNNGSITPPSNWQLAVRQSPNSSVGVAIYYYPNNPGSITSVSFSVTSSTSTVLQVAEFSGIQQSTPLDATGTAPAAAGADSITVSLTNNTGPALVIGAFGNNGDKSNQAFGNASSPFTNLFASGDVAGAASHELGTYNLSAGSGSLSETISTSNKPSDMIAAIASFKVAVTTYYWRGGLSGCAAGSAFTSTSCWATSSGGASSGAAPGTADSVVFDGAGNASCAMNAGVTVNSITVRSGYTATITHSSGNISLGGTLSIASGTFSSTTNNTTSIRTNQSGSYGGDLTITGGTFTASGAAIGVRSLTVSGASTTFSPGASAVSTNNSGTVTLSAGNITFGSGGLTPAGTVTVSGATVTMGNAAFTAPGAVTCSAGSMTFGSGNVAFNGGLTVSGTGAVTLGTGTTQTATSVTVSSSSASALTFGASSTFTNTQNFSQSAGTITGNGATINMDVASGDAFTMTGGTFNAGSGTITFGQTGHSSGATTTINGASAVFDGSSGTQHFQGVLTVTSGTLKTGTADMASGSTGGSGNTEKQVVLSSAGTLTLGSAGFDFPSTAAMTIDGTLNAGSGTVTFSGPSTLTISSTGTINGNTSATTFSNPVTVTGTINGNTSTMTFSSTLSVGGTFSGASGTQRFAGAVTVSGTLSTGNASLTGGSAATRLVTISSGGTMNLASSGFAFTSTTSMSIAGTLTASSSGGTVSFAGPVALTGTLNAGGATITVTGALTMTGTSAFNGNTGTTTFSAAPTLTAGTFTVGDAASTGSVTFNLGATFASGMTLAFPTSGSNLRLASGQTLTVNGTVTGSAGTAATLPKISCSNCSGTGITVAFGSTSVLNVDGLEFNNSVAAGVSIASSTTGPTYTKLGHLKFLNNVGGAGSTHLVITLRTQTIQVPGCYFDTTAATNVTLNGTSGLLRGARALFEYQSAAVNGSGAGESRDADGDNASSDPNPDNNYGENTATPYFGSVVQWSGASPNDIAGSAEGSPTAAFDWNTFAFYGIYTEYKNITGTGTADRLWVRAADGTASYYFDVPNAQGDLVGSPVWMTANETALGLDVNGDGDQTDTSVHVVYIATSLGRIIKLIDNGSTLARPAAGNWSSDFTSASVSTISSPLATDQTNLYFAGTGSSATKIFGVQVSAGAAEKTLVKNIGSVSAITAAISWKRISGVVYAYLGSTATSSQAYIYRVNVSPGAVVDAIFTGLTTSVNGSVRLQNNRAYAVTNGGQLHALDATNFGIGGFTNVSGYPYQTTAAVPIQAPAWIDSASGVAYFGDDSGKLYSVSSAGALATGYPYTVSSSAITSSPLYIPGTGIVVTGAADGFVYFIDRHNASGNPNLFSRYYVGAGAVTNVSYNNNTAQYMVSSQWTSAANNDGKLAFINASSVTDPTSSTE